MDILPTVVKSYSASQPRWHLAVESCWPRRFGDPRGRQGRVVGPSHVGGPLSFPLDQFRLVSPQRILVLAVEPCRPRLFMTSCGWQGSSGISVAGGPTRRNLLDDGTSTSVGHGPLLNGRVIANVRQGPSDVQLVRTAPSSFTLDHLGLVGSQCVLDRLKH